MKKSVCSLALGLGLLLAISGCSGKSGDNSVDHKVLSDDTKPLETLVDPWLRAPQAYTDEGAYMFDGILEDSANVYRGHRLMYVDYASKVKIPLCNQPNCTHDDETCPAWFKQSGLLVRVGDKLYMMQSSFQNENGVGVPATVVEMNLDGSEAHTVCSLEMNQTFGSPGVVGNEDFIFFKLEEFNKNDPENRSYSIARINLKEKNIEKICELKDEWNFIMGAYQDKLVVKTIDMNSHAFETELGFSQNKHRVILMGQNGEILDDNIASWKQDELTEWYDDGQLFLLNPNQGTLTIKNFDRSSDTIEIEDSQLKGGSATIEAAFDGGIIFEISHLDEGDMDYHFYLYKDGNITKSQYIYLGQDEDRLKNKIEAVNDTQYLVCRDFGTDDTTRRYALVDKEDYWNDAGPEKDIPIQNVN